MSESQKKFSLPLPEKGKDCHRILFRIDPKDIAYLVMIVEAYDGIGIPRTISQTDGTMEILASPDYVDDALRLLRALEGEVAIKMIKE